MKCDAMDWKLTSGGKDYVECDKRHGVKLYKLAGLLLSAKVHLCEAYRKWFEKNTCWLEKRR